ncbi:MAG: hypothetical protein AAF944_01060 [Bacteroidota bacterium]
MKLHLTMFSAFLSQMRQLYKNIVTILLVSIIVASCVPSKYRIEKGDLNERYNAAVLDAKNADPDEVSKDLISINPYNNELVKDSLGRILVSHWTDYYKYDSSSVGKTMKLSRDAWVLITPELKSFCNNLKLDSANTILRLEQLIGLPPKTNYPKFVEFWVYPQDLFRPCADPEISDCECELEIRESSHLQLNEKYLEWYNEKKNTSYSVKRYPWTRLGYTYDWGNSKSEIGLSEFVIREGAEVVVKSVTKSYQYATTR